MSWLEVLLAFMGNVKALALIGAILLGFIASVFFTIFAIDDSLEWKMLKGPAIILAILASIATIPNIDEIWKVRIAMIKFQLASPENLKSGSEVIERIGH